MKKRITVPPEEQLLQIKNGAEELIPESELLAKLKKSYKTQQPLIAKLGADPSRPDIHLGHTVVLNKLRLLQDFGHEVVFLIGDFTGLIGDPTGRNKTRPPLTPEEIQQNAQTYQDQVFQILDPDHTRVVFNSHWLGKLSSHDMVKLMAQVTLVQVLSRDDFSKRYQSEVPIFMHEFLYPLLQGYDSVELKADIELGGTDQKFNLLMGRHLQKCYGQDPQVILVMPILEGLDGVQKMSKSLDNYIGLTDTPTDMFGKVMSVSDDLMHRYYQLLSRLDVKILDRIRSDIKSGQLHPMTAKKDLAQIMVSHYHGMDTAQKEREHFESVFSKKHIPQDLAQHLVTVDANHHINIVDIACEVGFAKSKGEARRLLNQRAVKINGETLSAPLYSVKRGESYILKIGKLRMIQLNT